MTFIGIDVSKAMLDAAAILDTAVVVERSFTNNPAGRAQVLAWAASFPVRHITLEATGSYHQRLTAALLEAGERVKVLNPAQANYFAKSQARRNKTDRVDALMLAVYGKERQPAPSLATDTSLQSLARELNALQDDITRLKNRLEAAEHGLTHPEVAASIKRRIAALEEEKAALQERLERETRCLHERDLTLLESIPGIGTRSACLFLSEVGDIRRFPSAPKLVAFAGLSPMEVRSGSSVNKQTRISRLGSSTLRRILYMPALVAMRHNPIIKAFYERLVAKGKNKKSALLACAAKLLRIIYGVLIHQRPFNPTYATA